VLAVEYMSDGQGDLAAKTIEQAWQQSDAAKDSAGQRETVIGVGLRISELRGDAADHARWSARVTATDNAEAPQK
jgi:hypothetical protein